MNIQKIFQAVKDAPDQTTLIVAVGALEEQGYEVTINDKFSGMKDLIAAEENGDLDTLPMRNGVSIRVKKAEKEQTFRIHLLDIDAICFTDVDTPPVIYNPDFTTGLYKSGATN
jgi:hypothetical protein